MHEPVRAIESPTPPASIAWSPQAPPPDVAAVVEAAVVEADMDEDALELTVAEDDTAVVDEAVVVDARLVEEALEMLAVEEAPPAPLDVEPSKGASAHAARRAVGRRIQRIPRGYERLQGPQAEHRVHVTPVTW